MYPLPLIVIVLVKLSAAQENSGWLFSGSHNVPKKTDTDATQWLNQVLNVTNVPKQETKRSVTTNTPSTSSSDSCTTPDGKDGLCVTPEQCKTQRPPIDPTTLFIQRSSSCDVALLQCCELDQVIQKVNITKINKKPDKPEKNSFSLEPSTSSSDSCTTPDGKDGLCVTPEQCNTKRLPIDPTTLFTQRSSSCYVALLQCCALDQVIPKPNISRVMPDGCGWSYPGDYNLIVRDNDAYPPADFAEFPWMVAILNKSHDKAWTQKDYFGGGTLIHPSVVVTSAHRVFEKKIEQMVCRAGEWDTQSELELQEHQDRNVRKMTVHNDFVAKHLRYNAALLFLESPYDLKGFYHIGPACLARSMPAPGTICYSMGWGSAFNDTFLVNILKKIRVTTLDVGTCERQLRKSRLSDAYTLHNTLTCGTEAAGGESICVGDGGSPLVCPIQGDSRKRYAVYGMVAYGVTCGDENFPGVYVKLPAVRDWIDQEMTRENLGTNTYNV